MKITPTLLIRERLCRLMTWREFAKWVELPESTIYGILAGTKPTPLTEAKISAKLQARQAKRLEKAGAK